MSGYEFASSLVDHLVWPVLVMVALLLFRDPVTALIGRLRSYEGLGQKITFGDRLAEAEEAVGRAVDSVETPVGEAATPQRTDASPLAREAESNPSFAVVRAWEALLGAIADLSGAALADEPKARMLPGNPARMLPELQKRDLVTKEFVLAVNDLRNLRNRVAHGLHNPTAGEAVAFVEAADDLSRAAVAFANLYVRRRSDDADASGPTEE